MARSTTKVLLQALVLSGMLVPVENVLFHDTLERGGAVAEARRRRRTPRARRRLGRKLFLLGQRRMTQGEYEEAIKVFNRSFRLLPISQTLLALAQCYELAGKLEQARRLYRRMLKKPGRLERKMLQKRLETVERRMKREAGPPDAPAPPAASQPASQPVETPGGESVDTGEEDTGDTGDVAENIFGPDDGGDVTVAIAPGGEEDAFPDASPLEVSGLLSGWFRTALDVDLGHDRADGPTDVIEDSLELRHRLLLRMDVRYGGRYHGFVSVLLDHILREQPPNDNDTFLLFNGRDVKSDFDARVVEAYIAVTAWRLDIRAGMMRIPWGKSDYISPNDVVNPRDLRNPLREELELIRLPVLALETSLNIAPVTLEVVWQPLFQADRLTLYGGDFGVMTQHLPWPIRGLGRFIEGQHDDSLISRAEQLLVQTELPPQDFTASSLGARIALQFGGVDLATYYHFGWDPSPRLVLDPQVLQALAAIDWSAAQLQTFAPLLQLMDTGIPLYTSEYVRRHHAGADLVATLGSFSIRAELGFDTNRVFYDPQFTAHLEPAVSAGAGVEYQKSLYQGFLLEVSYLFVGGGPEELLFYDRNTVGVGGMARWGVLDGDLVGELRAYFGVKPWAYIVRPQVSYKISKRWTVSAGAVLLGGDTRSVGGFYDRNDLVFFEGTFNL